MKLALSKMTLNVETLTETQDRMTCGIPDRLITEILKGMAENMDHPNLAMQALEHTRQ